jgi:hypothetical protein
VGLSEITLHQTGGPNFEKFLVRWPDVAALGRVSRRPRTAAPSQVSPVRRCLLIDGDHMADNMRQQRRCDSAWRMTPLNLKLI